VRCGRLGLKPSGLSSIKATRVEAARNASASFYRDWLGANVGTDFTRDRRLNLNTHVKSTADLAESTPSLCDKLLPTRKTALMHPHSPDTAGLVRPLIHGPARCMLCLFTITDAAERGKDSLRWRR
jgi:hypothetical protein